MTGKREVIGRRVVANVLRASDACAIVYDVSGQRR
jgi:hypothetical protein